MRESVRPKGSCRPLSLDRKSKEGRKELEGELDMTGGGNLRKCVSQRAGQSSMENGNDEPAFGHGMQEGGASAGTRAHFGACTAHGCQCWLFYGLIVIELVAFDLVRSQNGFTYLAAA